MPTPPVSPRAAPPPFSRQRNRSRLVLGGLVLALAGVVLAGTSITVPTHVVAAATVADTARCAAADAHPGPAGCVLVRVDPSRVGGLGAGYTGRLTAADGSTVPIVLTPAAGPDGLAAPLDATPPEGAATAVVDVGRRPLALLFLGQGLEARP